MKFYQFTQNNSGGSFDVNENVCHRVIIEASSEKEAIDLFNPLIEDQSSSCSCCGDRWSYSPDEIELDRYKETGYSVGIYDHYKDAEAIWKRKYGMFPVLEAACWKKLSYSNSKEFVGKIYFNNIEEYVQMLANNYGWTSPDAIIYYANKTKTLIFKVD